MAKTAMIDVGGGFRAIFGCGVMDRMLEDGIDVDMCYGVSAGAANMTSFIARQHGRNHKVNEFNTDERNDHTARSVDPHIPKKQLFCLHRLILDSPHGNGDQRRYDNGIEDQCRKNGAGRGRQIHDI